MEKVFLIPEESKVDNQNTPKVAPFIDYVVDYLFNKYTKNGFWNMSNVLLVVPSVRIRKETLLQILIRAEKENIAFEIPQIVTIGRAPEYFYRQTRPFADEITQNLAWFRAIKMSDENKRKEFLPSMPGDDDLEGQFLLGQMFSKLHQSLSAEMLNFNDEEPKSERRIVYELIKFQKKHNDLNLKKEIERWKYFTEIKKNYLKILEENNLWDVQAARRYALVSPQPGDFETDLDIILAGIVDLNQVQKAILKEVSNNVTALIYAPESESNGFDDFGALNVKHWSEDLHCPLSDNQIVQVEKPEEQVLCAFDYIRQLNNAYTANQITIGVPDVNMIPYVQSAAEKLEFQIDNSIGQPISSSAPYALLLSISDFLESRRYESFANLIRHPAVYAAISKTVTGTNKNILSSLDNFQQEYFPLYISSDIFKNLEPSQSCSKEDINMVSDALKWVASWLSSLLKKEIDPKKLGKIITDIFNQLPKDKSSLNIAVESIIIKSCEKLNNLSKEFTGKLSPQSALKMIMQRLQSINLANGSDNNDDITDDELDSLTQSESSMTQNRGAKPIIHLAGWLELLWDRAPVLIILSFNEGIIPQSINANLFLPNELRKELKIMDNNRRFGRDAYTLNAMAASKEKLLAILGKYDNDDNALLPSRLLFNVNNFINQAYTFFSDKHDKQPLRKFTLSAQSPKKTVPATSSHSDSLKWAKENLMGNKLKGVVTEVSATKFKPYIECPFRFYLNYVINVEPTNYAVNELQPLSFGSIIHQVLQTWSQDELESGTYNWHPDKEELSSKLNAIVDKLFEQSYPNSVLPSIVIQKEIIKQRLKAFSEFQQDWEGNTIAVEKTLKTIVQLNDNEEMTLHGRIDRIDLLPNGDFVLLDYKTSDTGSNPNEDHLDKNKWINLQLPVYRHLLLANKELFPEFNENAEIKVGYINISKEKVAKFEDPKWADDIFKTAEDKISEVMENIHNGVFWPPSEDVKYDAYPEYVSWLMQDEE